MFILANIKKKNFNKYCIVMYYIIIIIMYRNDNKEFNF